MRFLIQITTSAALGIVVMTATSFGQIAARNSTARYGDSISPGQAPRFTLLLFWKQQDVASQSFAEQVRAAVEKNPDRASWNSIDIKEPANQAIVAQYGVSRAPMPLALCVADNGAVTGVFTRRPSVEALERAFVTPAMADVTKALQDKKIVIVHVKRLAESPLPAGAVDFSLDADFGPRTTVVDVVQSDPAEARFVADMQLKPQDLSGSVLVVMAPPGVLVGKFDDSATKAQLVAKLNAAGKCCDDPNCKHNQKAQ